MRRAPLPRHPVQRLRLLKINRGIRPAVQRQDRHAAGLNVSDRRGEAEHRRVDRSHGVDLGRTVAQRPLSARRAVLGPDPPIRNIRYPVEIDPTADRTGKTGIRRCRARGLQFGHAGRQRHHEREVPARGAARHRDAIGVELIFSGLGAEKAHGILAVEEVRWPGAGPEPVVDADDDVTGLGQGAADAAGPRLVFRAAHPAPAVDPDQSRRTLARRRRSRQVKIELLGALRREKRDVLGHAYGGFGGGARRDTQEQDKGKAGNHGGKPEAKRPGRLRAE